MAASIRLSAAGRSVLTRPFSLHAASLLKFKRSVNKVNMMGAMDSLPLHYFKDHQKYAGKDKLPKPDRMRQKRILESLHMQFSSMLEDVEFLHRCFTLLDGDDDGKIDPTELGRWIAVLSDGEAPSNEDLKDAVDKMPMLTGTRGALGEFLGAIKRRSCREYLLTDCL